MSEQTDYLYVASPNGGERKRWISWWGIRHILRRGLTSARGMRRKRPVSLVGTARFLLRNIPAILQARK